MNAARQLISRRLVSGMGPRLTTSARFASTAAHHSVQKAGDRSFMYGIFGAATAATAGAVTYGATKSGRRMNNRYTKKNSTLDSSKWFLEGSDVNNMLGTKH